MQTLETFYIGRVPDEYRCKTRMKYTAAAFVIDKNNTVAEFTRLEDGCLPREDLVA